MRRAFFYATLSTLSLVAGAKAATRGSTLVFGRAIESQHLDPVHTVQNVDIWLSLNLYDTLLLPAEDGKRGTEPGLATGYKGS